MGTLEARERAYLDALYGVYNVNTLDDKRDFLLYITSEKGRRYCAQKSADQSEVSELEQSFIYFTREMRDKILKEVSLVRLMKKMPM
jgi:hypothetical protein